MPLVSCKAISNYFHISSIVQILHNSIEDVCIVYVRTLELLNSSKTSGLSERCVHLQYSLHYLAYCWLPCGAVAVHFTLIISRTLHITRAV